MERRFFLQGGAAALVGMLTGCDGGSDDEVLESGYEHSFGLEMVPDARQPSYSPGYLLTPTPGVGFKVTVKLGAQPQAGVPVKIYDANSAMIDAGTTDAQGEFVSSKDGRYFLFATAEAGGGELYGTELNFGTKNDPVIEVNFLGTLYYQLSQRLQSSGKSVDFVLRRYFGIEPETDLTDLDVFLEGLHQDLIRSEYEASGLRLGQFIARLVEEILASIDEGFEEESYPYGVMLGWQGESSLSESCVPQGFDFDTDFNYQDSAIFERDGFIIEAINTYYPIGIKKLMEFGTEKAAAMAGTAGPVISGVGGLIIGAIFPPEDKVGKAIEAATTKIIASIDNGIQRVIDRINTLDFENRFLLVKNIFDAYYTQIKKIESATRSYKKLASPTPEDEEDYRRNALEFSNKLIALEDELVKAHNIFFGIGGYSRQDSVLEKWFPLVQQSKFYTSLLQEEFLAIFNYFTFYNNICYTYLVDAYDTRAEISGARLDRLRVELIRNRWEQSIANIENVRPQYLMSEKQVIDLHNDTMWVGRCNRISIREFNRIRDRRAKDATLTAMQYESPLVSCRPLGDPVAGPGIGAKIVNAHDWRLPSEKLANLSFGDEIKKMAKANKKFNLGDFAEKHRIPAAFFFFNKDEGTKREPVRFLLDDYKSALFDETLYVATFFSLKNLQREVNITHTVNSTAWFFPMAKVTSELRQKVIPWERYRAGYSSLKALDDGNV